MDDQLYREIILEHWKNPQNYGVIENADLDITDYNPLCGDKIRITATISPSQSFRQRPEPSLPQPESKRRLRSSRSDEGNDNKITQIKFEGQGCAISQASASILTELVQSQSLNDVKNLSQQDYLQNLEVTLSPARLKCALLSYSALQKGLTNLP